MSGQTQFSAIPRDDSDEGLLRWNETRALVQTVAELIAAASDANQLRIKQAGHAQEMGALDTQYRKEFARDLGLGPGVTVVVEAAQTARSAGTLLAALSLGAAVCPIDPAAPEDVKQAIAAEAQASAYIDADGNWRKLDNGNTEASRFRLRTPRRVTGVDLALVIFTSGSSGRPKGIRLTQANVMAALRSIAAYLQLKTTDKILCVPPLHFDYGLYQLLLGIFTPCTAILPENGGDPLRTLRTIEHESITVLPVVPAMALGLIRVLSAFRKLRPEVRLITNTGGHLPHATIERLRAGFPSAQVMPMYGLTESKRALYMPPHMVDKKVGSVGIPMPGLDAKVFIEEAGEPPLLREAAPREIGELYVRGASVMQGYHTSTASAGARLIQGAYRDDIWLATGDLFVTDEDGFLYFRGRSKSLIKQAGHCIYPRDLEDAAETISGVCAAAAVGATHEDGDESAYLYIELAQDADEIAQEAIRVKLADILPKTLQPRAIVFVNSWPQTKNGKVDRNALEEDARKRLS